MFRVIRVLLILGVLAGTFLLFDKNSESITIYFFRDNGYDLDTVKKTKLVNVGNQLTKLPKELKNIESPKKRKKLFINFKFSE